MENFFKYNKMNQFEISSVSIGDYLAPEQKVGEFNMKAPWESYMIICKKWSWKPNDKIISLKECIQTLVKTVSLNGNVLFNVGPMKDGRIDARQIQRHEEMANWIEKYGVTIYGTEAGPYKLIKLMQQQEKEM